MGIAVAFQDKLVEEKDEFIESLALTTEKIRRHGKDEGY